MTQQLVLIHTNAVADRLFVAGHDNVRTDRPNCATATASIRDQPPRFTHCRQLKALAHHHRPTSPRSSEPLAADRARPQSQ